ncbi:MAG: allantoicase [Myxococcales bacterium]|nr:allantoicase [Myxococcales bacterium]
MTMSDFTHLPDLAGKRLGGLVLWASDDFFAPKESLLEPAKAVFDPDRYTVRGKEMDGWESRRKRRRSMGRTGHDSAIIELGLPGTLRGIDVDTSFFLGNYPAACSLDAVRLDHFVPTERMDGVPWREVLPRSLLQGGQSNRFALADEATYTHLRLHIYPDGGVARLRLYGEVRPDWERLQRERGWFDLAAMENGGRAVVSTDDFFSHKSNLIVPGRSSFMGDGWETKRRRGGADADWFVDDEVHDWVVIELGRPGRVHKLEVDTNHFKGNFPDTVRIEAAQVDGPLAETVEACALLPWRELLPRTPLEAHRRHRFAAELADLGVVTHLRMSIFPDGGISRLRAWGVPEGLA